MRSQKGAKSEHRTPPAAEASTPKPVEHRTPEPYHRQNRRPNTETSNRNGLLHAAHDTPDSSTQGPTESKQSIADKGRRARKDSNTDLDPDLEVKGATTSTCHINFGVSPLFIIGVLISTIIWCTSTPHNAHPQMRTSLLSPPRFHSIPPLDPSTICLPKGRLHTCSQLSNYYMLTHLPTCSPPMITHTKHPSSYHLRLPQRSKNPPRMLISPSPPTHHQTTNHKVSKRLALTTQITPTMQPSKNTHTHYL